MPRQNTRLEEADIDDLLAERGNIVTHETIRQCFYALDWNTPIQFVGVRPNRATNGI